MTALDIKVKNVHYVGLNVITSYNINQCGSQLTS